MGDQIESNILNDTSESNQIFKLEEIQQNTDNEENIECSVDQCDKFKVEESTTSITIKQENVLSTESETHSVITSSKEETSIPDKVDKTSKDKEESSPEEK